MHTSRHLVHDKNKYFKSSMQFRVISPSQILLNSRRFRLFILRIPRCSPVPVLAFIDRDLGRHTVGGRRRQIISSPQLYPRTIVFERWGFEVQIARSPEIATEISRSEQRYSSRDLVPHVGLAGETVLVSDNAFSGERTLRSFSLYRDVPKTAIPNVSDSF